MAAGSRRHIANDHYKSKYSHNDRSARECRGGPARSRGVMRDTSAPGEVSLSLELLDHSRPVDRPAVLTGRLEEPDLTKALRTDFGEDFPGLVVGGIEHEVHCAAGDAPAALPRNRTGLRMIGIRAENTGDDGHCPFRISWRQAHLVYVAAGAGARHVFGFCHGCLSFFPVTIVPRQPVIG